MINFNLKTQLSWNEIAVRAAFVVVTVAAIVWFMPRETRFAYKVERGTPWRYADLTATIDFPVLKNERALENEREERLKELVPYYRFDDNASKQQVSLFKEHFDDISLPLSSDFKIMIINRLRDIYKQNIVDSREALLRLPRQTIKRYVDHNTDTISVADVITPREAYEQLLRDPDLRQYEAVLQELGLHEFIVPNLLYDSVYNQQARDDVIKNIAVSSKMVQRGQKIISRGDIVDDDTYQVLESYQRELDEQYDANETGTTMAGKTLYVFLFILAFTVYLGMYRKDYFDRLRTASMLYAFIVVFSLLASLLVSHSMMHVFILPFAVVPIFVRVFMDSRTAFITHVTLVLIVALVLQRPLEFIAVEVVGGLAVIFSLRELSSRSQLFWTAALFMASAMATNFALFLARQGDLSMLDGGEYTYLIICGIIVFCSYPLLYVIEKTFGFVSDITLVELSNTNKDVLRRMSEVAPGTFNHSIQVGNLAAEVARKLDANAQLVRTGALYHDIGKIQNPIYYTENQTGGISPHEHLTYIESAQYIISHVTEGLKLADKYHLPKQIRDLIATHHGQGKAKYFYIKYNSEHPDEPVDDLLFTYPGPNPFTKEQAILMMADAVEAASRSLPDYTEQSIRQLVDRIIDSQVSDGFFRDCPVTFRDIQYAKTVLIEKLKTIYHTRISYPEERK